MTKTRIQKWKRLSNQNLSLEKHSILYEPRNCLGCHPAVLNWTNYPTKWMEYYWEKNASSLVQKSISAFFRKCYFDSDRKDELNFSVEEWFYHRRSNAVLFATIRSTCKCCDFIICNQGFILFSRSWKSNHWYYSGLNGNFQGLESGMVWSGLASLWHNVKNHG